MNPDFLEYFHGLEGFHFRSERFSWTLTGFRTGEESEESIIKWLEAAFIAGQESKTNGS